jgi:hypothetical protein
MKQNHTQMSMIPVRKRYVVLQHLGEPICAYLHVHRKNPIMGWKLGRIRKDFTL